MKIQTWGQILQAVFPTGTEERQRALEDHSLRWTGKAPDTARAVLEFLSDPDGPPPTSMKVPAREVVAMLRNNLPYEFTGRARPQSVGKGRAVIERPSPDMAPTKAELKKLREVLGGISHRFTVASSGDLNLSYYVLLVTVKTPSVSAWVVLLSYPPAVEALREVGKTTTAKGPAKAALVANVVLTAIPTSEDACPPPNAGDLEVRDVLAKFVKSGFGISALQNLRATDRDCLDSLLGQIPEKRKTEVQRIVDIFLDDAGSFCSSVLPAAELVSRAKKPHFHDLVGYESIVELREALTYLNSHLHSKGSSLKDVVFFWNQRHIFLLAHSETARLAAKKVKLGNASVREAAFEQLRKLPSGDPESNLLRVGVLSLRDTGKQSSPGTHLPHDGAVRALQALASTHVEHSCKEFDRQMNRELRKFPEVRRQRLDRVLLPTMMGTRLHSSPLNFESLILSANRLFFVSGQNLAHLATEEACKWLAFDWLQDDPHRKLQLMICDPNAKDFLKGWEKVGRDFADTLEASVKVFKEWLALSERFGLGLEIKLVQFSTLTLSVVDPGTGRGRMVISPVVPRKTESADNPHFLVCEGEHADVFNYYWINYGRIWNNASLTRSLQPAPVK